MSSEDLREEIMDRRARGSGVTAMDSYLLCGKAVVLGPYASKSDTCAKPFGHLDLVHHGQYRDVEWTVDDDGHAWCGAAAADGSGWCCGLEVPCPTHPPADTSA